METSKPMSAGKKDDKKSDATLATAKSENQRFAKSIIADDLKKMLELIGEDAPAAEQAVKNWL